MRLFSRKPKALRKLEPRQRLSLVTAQAHIALLDLGDTPEEVYETLRTAGIKGRRLSPGACPVSRYLQSFKGADWVSVGVTSATLFVKDQQAEVRVPLPVQAFISSFDACAPARYADICEKKLSDA